MHVRHATLMIVLGLGSASTAQAKDTSYRVTEAKPSKRGATLQIFFENEWGSAAENERHGSLNLYGYVDGAQRTAASTDYKTGNYYHSGAIKLGTFKWVGTGETKVELDYQALGLKPGTKLLTQANFFWGDHGHNWGDTEGGKPAGGPFVLPEPAATKNSWLASRPGRSLRPIGNARWSSWATPRGAPLPWLAPRPRLGGPRR